MFYSLFTILALVAIGMTVWMVQTSPEKRIGKIVRREKLKIVSDRDKAFLLLTDSKDNPLYQCAYREDHVTRAIDFTSTRFLGNFSPALRKEYRRVTNAEFCEVLRDLA